MDSNTYTQEQIAFVSNLNGSTMHGIVASLIQVPLSVAFIKLYNKKINNCCPRSFLFANWVIIAPILLSLTMLSQFLLELDTILLIIILFMLLNKNEKYSVEYVEYPISFVSLFRGATCLVTCISILGVDFPVFPRYYAKTEMFGTGLMDFGTGIFIFSSAVTSSVSRQVYREFTDSKKDFSMELKKKNSMTFQINQKLISKSFFSKNLLVLALGFGRLLVLKLAEYHEHVIS